MSRRYAVDIETWFGYDPTENPIQKQINLERMKREERSDILYKGENSIVVFNAEAAKFAKSHIADIIETTDKIKKMKLTESEGIASYIIRGFTKREAQILWDKKEMLDIM